MLYQTDIYTAGADSSELFSELSVKIHGAVMKAIPAEYATRMHEKTYHPFSVFSVKNDNSFIIRVSALTDEASVIPDTLCKLDSLVIYGMKNPLEIVGFDRAEPISADNAEEYIGKRGCRITFVTPAMIKTAGKPSAKPDICSFFLSVVKRYNMFENAEISFGAFKDAFDNIRFGNYQLNSSSYNVSGHIFPGMTGYCELFFPKDNGQNTLLRRIIAYASYSGIGGKTGQGMGGITVEDI